MSCGECPLPLHAPDVRDANVNNNSPDTAACKGLSISSRAHPACGRETPRNDGICRETNGQVRTLLVLFSQVRASPGMPSHGRGQGFDSPHLHRIEVRCANRPVVTHPGDELSMEPAGPRSWGNVECSWSAGPPREPSRLRRSGSRHHRCHCGCDGGGVRACRQPC
jgi:hypothetical protein